MHRCASPEHPHCSTWVMTGEPLCAHGHAQPRSAADTLDASYGMISRLRTTRDAEDAIRPAAAVHAPAPETPEPAYGRAVRPHLHVSGFDPRAAGGRQAVKLELRAMPADAPARLALLLRSDLLADGGARLTFTRGLHGEWRPAFLEFSSRGREHGQYRIDVELHAEDGAARTWVATLVLLVPRADASLGEIHQTYLSTHKNVRIHADDGAIARLQGLDAAGAMDIEIDARNASIAQLDFGSAGSAGSGRPGGGKIDLALSTLAWDEDLIEIDLRGALQADPGKRSVHPCAADSACLVYAEPDAGAPRHLRLFALDECVLGRFDGEAVEPEADLLLQHHGDAGPEAGGLTRRLSARHALVRTGRGGFEIEDVSRYGVLLDGVWPGKHKPVPLRLGMRIELTASIRGVVTLVVTALHPHALVLHRVDGGGAAECFMLLAPGQAPSTPADAQGAPASALPRAAALPLIFHRGGGFWHLDPVSGHETPLAPATALERLSGFNGRVRFCAGARPDDAHPAHMPELPACDARRSERRGLATARALDA
jgi:hypothetical protein